MIENKNLAIIKHGSGSICYFLLAEVLFNIYIEPASISESNLFVHSNQLRQELTWAEAKEFCRQQGAKLPLVNGRESSDYPVAQTPIDGFGVVGGPWPTEFADLPKAVRFWTGAEDISDMEEGEDTAWYVYERGGTVGVGNTGQDKPARVVCVP